MEKEIKENEPSNKNEKDPDEFKEAVKKTIKVFSVVCEHVSKILDEIFWW